MTKYFWDNIFIKCCCFKTYELQTAIKYYLMFMTTHVKMFIRNFTHLKETNRIVHV